jgi:hypothetical protein
MIPYVTVGERGVYINDLKVAHLNYSNGRRGHSEDGYSMFSYNGEPLGWIGDGWYLHECIAAELLLAGTLDPKWEQVPTGLRLIHPRYTLNIVQTSTGWVPTICDELTKRSHSLQAQTSCANAVRILETVLRRRVGRERPRFVPHWQYAEIEPGYHFQLALPLISPLIMRLIRNNQMRRACWGLSPPPSVSKVVTFFDQMRRSGLDLAPQLTAWLATFIKCALIDFYRGANSVIGAPNDFVLTFTTKELADFRDWFRRSPLTDRDYLNLVERYFTSQLQPLYRGRLARKRGFLRLRFPRDRADCPLCWPLKPGTRLFDAELKTDWSLDCATAAPSRGRT